MLIDRYPFEDVFVRVPELVQMRTMRRGLQTLDRLRRRVGEDRAEERKSVYETLLKATAATITQAERANKDY